MPELRRALPYAAIAAGFVGALMVIDPRGDFPLDDDWNFALATWHFAETGAIRLARFTAMSLRGQILWGALFTAVFGKSFEVLRASVLVLSLATLWVFFRFLGDLGIERSRRWIALLVFALHPIFVWSSFTYMTHVPFLFTACVALWQFHRAITRGSIGSAAAGALAVTAGFFIRQTAVALVVAPLAVLWLHGAREPKRFRIAALAAAPAVLFLILFSFTSVVRGYPEEQEMHFASWGAGAVSGIASLGRNLLHHTLLNFEFAAIFCAPLTVLLVARFPWRDRRRLLMLMALAVPFLVLTSARVGAGDPFPFRIKGNVLIDFGLGPPTLRDTFVLGEAFPFGLPPAISVLLSYLAASPFYFDRYALDSLWPAIPLLALRLDGRRAAALALLVVVGFFSIFGTREYLAWNRARWAAYADLRAAGVGLDRMDGGYEINQYLLGGFDGRKDLALPGWSVISDEYVLAFRSLRGYETVRTYPFSGFLGLREGAVHVERRVSR